MMTRRQFFHNTVALVYDFDGTLSPQPMQEYTILPELNIKAKDFWEEVSEETKETESEMMLVYMRLLLEKAEQKGIHLDKDKLTKLGKDVKYFPGVETWFERINNFVKTEGNGNVKIEHYIISSGMMEILDGISIRKYFKNIYASAYHFNHHNTATFPKLLITDTNKTQFLYRINKGKLKLAESINDHMPDHERAIPFSNIVYFGDGETDIPSMTVTKVNGGHAIAVYKKQSGNGLKVCRKLLDEKRVHFIAPADYSEKSILEKRVRLLLKSVIADIEYQRELFGCRRENSTDL
ncbi:MAG: HAD family hydrolase [Candidatus Anammoxibacter sp.]